MCRMDFGTTPAKLTLWRYVLVGAIVPLLFGWLDHYLLAKVMRSASTSNILPVLLVFVVQVGTFGVLCGKLIDWPLMRWFIYGWCWLLVNLQLLTASALATPSWHDQAAPLLTSSMFAAQIGLVTIWAVLGTTWWGWRWPASLVLVGMLSIPLANSRLYRHDLDYLFAIQSLSLLGLCLALRWKCFRLLHEPTLKEEAHFQAVHQQWRTEQANIAVADTPTPAAINPSIAKLELRQRQFGLRHVMIWMTSLAILLGIARGLDLLSSQTLRNLIGRGWIGILTMGLLSAIVLIVALWAGLGAGRLWVRWLLLATISTVMTPIAVVIGVLIGGGGFQRPRFWTFEFYVQELMEHWALVLQNMMAGALLYATLLMFRTLGYRLLRQQRKGNSVANTA